MPSEPALRRSQRERERTGIQQALDLSNLTRSTTLFLHCRSFGKDKGEWANLEGTHFEGALLSSSDVERLCENPTLDLDVKKYELGCRASK